MKVAVIGTGYVGLVTGTCFAESGNHVTCVDIDPDKVESLRKGRIPIYEPGLEELVLRNSKAGRLDFTTDYAEAVPGAEVVFIAVGTPQGDDGAANLKGLWSVTDSLAPHLDEDALVVTKSTVPVGTNRKVYERLKKETGREQKVASNPEFLKEGAAIDDFTKPDRVVVGVLDPAHAEPLRDLHAPFLRTERPFLVTGLESAEMIKYVANCMLATKISFINEMANLCELVGADVNDVRRGIGHDQRIGFQFLFPGVGYGGSCFPKDVRALMAVAEQHAYETHLLDAVDSVNTRQKHVLFRKIDEHFGGELSGRTVAVWGLSFKPRTDDIREAPALELVRSLLNAGVGVRVHDPVAMDNVRKEIGDVVTYCDTPEETLDGADCLAICTEWNEFRNPDFDVVKSKLSEPVVFDGRNLYDTKKMADLGFHYDGIGLKSG